MTLLTPSFALPYPSATDAPCDFADQWCTFTEAVTGVLDTFETAVNRTVPLVPVAQMLVTIPIVVAVSQFVAFDTVTVDTVSWIDFDSDRTSITVNRAGRFVVTGSAVLTTSGVLNNFMFMNINAASDASLDRADGGIGLCVSQLFSIASPTPFQMTATSAAASTVRIETASMSVYWHADGGAP